MSEPNPGKVMRAGAWCVVALFAHAATHHAHAQAYYNNGGGPGAAAPLFTTGSPGVVTVKPGTSVSVGGTVAITGTVPITASSPLAVTQSTPPLTPVAAPVDCTAVIAVAGTAQMLVPATPTRRALTIQNNGTAPVGLSLSGTAPLLVPTAASATLLLAAGASYQSPVGFLQATAVYVVGPSAGQVIFCTAFE